MNKILVVAAHPDDEILGVGGTILKHANSQDEINVLILGDGETARKTGANIKKRQSQAKAVAKILGVKNLFLEKLPDNRFDSIPLLKITQKVENILHKVKPNLIYTHFPHDLNVDHRLTFQAVLTASRPQPNFFVKEIMTFETLSSTEWQLKDRINVFCPTEYVDIGNFLDKKIEALKIYKNELREHPHPRSIEGVKTLARYRGMEVGFPYAEAFERIRKIHG